MKGDAPIFLHIPLVCSPWEKRLELPSFSLPQRGTDNIEDLDFDESFPDEQINEFPAKSETGGEKYEDTAADMLLQARASQQAKRGE